MKQFLYLDTDIINSIIAQAGQGLIQSSVSETTSTTTESNTLNGGLEASAVIGASALKLAKAEANIKASIGGVLDSSMSSTSHDIISKTLHDAAFDIAYEHITPYCAALNDQAADEHGSYIEVTRVFDFVDLDYFEGLFKNDGLIDFLKKSEAEKIRQELDRQLEDLNREQARKIKETRKKEEKDLIEANNKKYDDIAVILKLLRTLVPYNRMLISLDGYMIPLNTKYFRVDPIEFGFKYGGEITCVGMVTNIVGKDTDPNDTSNIFATLQYTSSEMLRSLLPTKSDNLCILHPIAVYYGH